MNERMQVAVRSKRPLAAVVLGGAALIVLCACGRGHSTGGTNGTATPASAMTPPPKLFFLHVGPAGGPSNLRQIVDSNGRLVLLRGVNINGLRDDYVDSATPLQTPYPIDPVAYLDGRCPARDKGVPTIALCSLDAGQLRSFGYDSVRLTVSWSLLEPQPNVIDQTYIDRIAQVVEWFKQAGIYTVIDMHQDAWSKYVFTPADLNCPPPFKSVRGSHEADGAPAWASTPVTPACALAGIREIDSAVEESFQDFWNDLPGPDGVGLQEHFAKVVVVLARRFHDNPAVAGYELFNEPLPGLIAAAPLVDLTETFPFYAKVIKTVLDTVPDFRQLFVIEPDIVRDVSDNRAVFAPWSLFSSYPNVVYAPHVYTHVFTPDAEIAGAGVLSPLFPLDRGYNAAVSDALALDLPLWVDEFGIGVKDDDTILRGHYQLQDQLAIGSSLWVWKGDGNADNTDGFTVLHGPFPPGAPFPSRVKFTGRAYPIYTAGTLTNMSYDPDTGAFDLRASSASVAIGDRDHATLIFVPAVSTATIHADGAHLEVFDRGDGSREVNVYPDGGAYHVH